jgi:16S rRNA G966 N2-methylase RsmD
MMVRWLRKRKPGNLIYAIQYTGQINQIQATRAASGNGGRFFIKILDTVLKWAYSANRLLFGDNLQWLRDTKIFPDASVDLVYLDPPFNSNADYNVLLREATGEASQTQFHAFTDTWSWADAAGRRW